MPTLIYLIGFMGSGKSTLGQILANVIGFDFVDLDQVLEARLGRPIAEYFADEGETAFREAEQALVRECTQMKRTVIAAGGGAFLIEENRMLMRSSGLTVYLRLSVPLLATRLRSSRGRPLLYDENDVTLKGQALNERIASLLEDRRPYYELADLVVDIDDRPIGLAVDQIAAAIHSSAKSSG